MVSPCGKGGKGLGIAGRSWRLRLPRAFASPWIGWRPGGTAAQDSSIESSQAPLVTCLRPGPIWLAVPDRLWTYGPLGRSCKAGPHSDPCATPRYTPRSPERELLAYEMRLLDTKESIVVRGIVAKRLRSLYVDVPAAGNCRSLRPRFPVCWGCHSAAAHDRPLRCWRSVHYFRPRHRNHNADQRVRRGPFLRRTHHCCDRFLRATAYGSLSTL
jgi:hypothetical protein